MSRAGQQSGATTPSRFPLSAEPNGRYLIDATGRPFFMVGDSAQKLLTTSFADIASYLRTRQSQGFNTVLVELIGVRPTAYQTGNGVYPFNTKSGGGAYAGAAGTADFSSPNDAYFDYCVAAFKIAQQLDMLLVVYPLPWGFAGDGSQGWWLDLGNAANTQSVCNTFGQYLGNKFKAFKNIVWLDGSDYFGTTTTNAPDNTTGIQRAYAVAQGMQTAGALQLRSGDWTSPSSSTDGPQDRPGSFVPAMQVNGVYSYGGTFTGVFGTQQLCHTFSQSRLAYNYTPAYATQGNVGATSAPPAMPAYLKETAYEHSPFVDGSVSSVRRCHYWALLSGCTTGFIYGDENVWPFVNGTWQTAMTDGSQPDVTRLADLFRSYKWHSLVPSECAGMRLLVPSANGTQVGEPNGYIAAACASDGSFLFAYAPVNGVGTQTFTLDTRSLNGTKRCRWFDPTSSVYSAASPSTVSNGQSAQSFTTPGNNAAGDNDWVLVLDNP